MFNLKNNHKTEVEIKTDKAHRFCIDYADRLADAFQVLEEIEALLSSPLTTNDPEGSSSFTMPKISGRDFGIKLKFSHDNNKPFSAELIYDD